MKEQVSLLFSMEYRIPNFEFEKLMGRLYEHPFQKNKCIQIVALDKDKVVGFQSFFYWPYQWKNKIYNSYQSGNSLVHPDYRGKRIFTKLLNHINEIKLEQPIDFLVGFPVVQSYNSFIRNGWQNPFNLQWLIKTINPFAFIYNTKKLSQLQLTREKQVRSVSLDLFQLSFDPEFTSWKKQLSEHQHNYFTYTYSNDGNVLEFDLKFQKRKKLIHELIIGSIKTNTLDKEVIANALNQLELNVKKTKCVSILSIAINEHLTAFPILSFLQAAGFRKINKQIHFIYKPVHDDTFKLDTSITNICRADIDTW